MRAPDAASYTSNRSSRSRKQYSSTFMAPQSIPAAPSHSRWFNTRVISANMTRMYWARIGTSMPSIFSTARQ